MDRSCAFTGHRYDLEEFDEALLGRVVKNLITTGIDTFYCGMAVGFDLCAAEKVTELKKDYNVKLIACIPCEGQSDAFSENDKERYNKILNSCDEQILLNSRYFNGCMQLRDRFMVDNSDVLVCFLRKDDGGTFYTVNYARRKGIKIIEI